MKAASRANVVSSFTIVKGAMIDESYAVFATWDFARSKRENLLRVREENTIGASSVAWLRFVAKVPGLGLDIRGVNMDFTYGSAFSVDSPDAYETLILDGLLGDGSLFTRADEVEQAWSIVTPIIESWVEMPAPDFPNYAAGSWGPEAADHMIERDGRRWRRI